MVDLALPDDFWTRLRAWWNGAEALSPDDQAVLAAALAGNGRDTHAWTPERIAAVQMVCGDGSTIPGGGHFAKQSLRYLGLNSAMSVVDYGARLGLFGRVAAKTAGAWVDACEPEPALAAAARQLTRGRRLTKRTRIHDGDLLETPIRDHAIDAVIAVEAMHRSAQRIDHLNKIARMLKPGGRLLMIDLLREIKAPSSPAIERWRRAEMLPAALPRLEHVQMALRQLRLRVSLTQDITDEYSGNLTKGLKRLAAQLRRHPPDGAMHAALLREVEFWGARLQVLKSGDVSVLRLLAVRPQPTH